MNIRQIQVTDCCDGEETYPLQVRPLLMKSMKLSTEDEDVAAPPPSDDEDGPGPGPQLMSASLQPEQKIMHENRILPMDLLFKQINDTNRAHAKTACKKPLFTIAEEIQWGVMVRQSWKCVNCKFQTPMVKLYDEVHSPGKPGPKAAKQNVAFVTTLMHTSIGVTRGQLLLNALDIPVPNKKTLFTISRQVSSSLSELSKRGMSELLETVAEETGEVHLTLDARYNTARWSCDRRNGLHNTTQFVALAMANTPEKPIVCQYTESKVCPTGTALLLKGEDIECPGHAGCTATINRYESLTERAAGQHIGRSVADQGVQITHVTTDGDAKLFKGVEEVTPTPVQRCSDTVHLGQTQVTRGKEIEWSEHLFPGCKLKGKKKEYTNALAMDIRNRSFAILKALHQKHDGNLPDIQTEAPDAILAAICCYQGDCTRCPSNTTACQGTEDNNESWALKSSLLQEHNISNLNTTPNDVELMKNILELVLGHENLEKTKFLSHTNHNEAANRCLAVSVPKNIKFSRCLHGRVACVIDTWNYGIREAVTRQYQELGLNISNGQAEVLRRMQHQNQYQKAYTRSPSKKQLRRKRDNYLRLNKRLAQPKSQGDYEKHHLDSHNYHQVCEIFFLLLFVFVCLFMVRLGLGG